MNSLDILRAFSAPVGLGQDEMGFFQNPNKQQQGTCFACQKPAPKLKKCTRCRRAEYCNNECQMKHFEGHKEMCCKYTMELHVLLGFFQDLNKRQGACHACQRPAPRLKKCTRCERAEYCNRQCQKKHYERHKEMCSQLARFDKAKSKLDPNLCGDVVVSFSLGDVTDTDRQRVLGPCKYVLVEILGVQPPSVFNQNTAIEIRDAVNKKAAIVFCLQNNPECLSSVKLKQLEKGNYVLIKHGRWSVFGGGLSSLAVEHLNQVEIVEMKDEVDWVAKPFAKNLLK